MDCEFHFQEGFAGDLVVLAVDGTPLMREELTTRLQIGHARTETLRLGHGQDVVVSMPGRGLSATIRVEPGDRYFVVDVVDGELQIRRSPTSPGYL